MAQGWVGGTCVNMPYDTATWLGKYYTFLILQYESMEVLGLANPVRGKLEMAWNAVLAHAACSWGKASHASTALSCGDARMSAAILLRALN
eukprot:1156160-Pelagomonas_calceolata.AAC.6